MDPNATLRNLLKNVKEARGMLAELRQLEEQGAGYTDNQLFALEDLAEEMADRVEALDGWLRKGGFLPKRWRKTDGRTDQQKGAS